MWFAYRLEVQRDAVRGRLIPIYVHNARRSTNIRLPILEANIPELREMNAKRTVQYDYINLWYIEAQV